MEQYLADGLWLKVSEHRTADGGTASIYTDITWVKRREAELNSKTAMLESLWRVGRSVLELSVMDYSPTFDSVWCPPAKKVDPKRKPPRNISTSDDLS